MHNCSYIFADPVPQGYALNWVAGSGTKVYTNLTPTEKDLTKKDNLCVSLLDCLWSEDSPLFYFKIIFRLPALWAEYNVVQGNVARVAISNASFESHLPAKKLSLNTLG
jgi:hypothetical protein